MGTVPVESARGLNGTYSITAVDAAHTALVSDPVACQIASDFVSHGTVSTIPFAPAAAGFVTVIAHSPVALDVVDAQGRHTTISDDGIVQENPDAKADYFGEAKAITLPSDVAADVEILGTGDGAVTLEVIRSTPDGVQISSQRWLELPVSSASSGRVALVPGSALLDWDADGDNQIDYNGGPDADGDGVPDALDRYHNTPLDAVVNEQGGSLAQIVPIDGSWRNRGEFISAFVGAARDFVRSGLLTPQQAADAIKVANEQFPRVGKPRPPKCQSGRWHHHRTHWETQKSSRH